MTAMEQAKRTGRCPHCGTGVVVVPDPPCVIETDVYDHELLCPVHCQHTSQRCRSLRAEHCRPWQALTQMCAVVYRGQAWGRRLPCVLARGHGDMHADWYGRTWRAGTEETP